MKTFKIKDFKNIEEMRNLVGDLPFAIADTYYPHEFVECFLIGNDLVLTHTTTEEQLPLPHTIPNAQLLGNIGSELEIVDWFDPENIIYKCCKNCDE